jgi:hypothetical protein
MKGIIDRFEGIYGIIEMDDGKMKRVERDKLPSEATEGDIIQWIEGKILICKKETAERKKQMDRKLDELMK